MAALSGEQVAQIVAQAGFTGNDLINFVGIARRESGWRPDAIRTDNPGGNTGDWGLFQINRVNLQQLGAIGITSMQQLLDPVTNARAAFYLFQKSGYFPWGMGPNGWQAGGDPLKGVNLDVARAAVESAQARGMLGQAYQGGSVSTTPGATGGPAVTNSGPVQLPPDAQIYNIAGTMDIWAVFDVGGGVKLSYKVDTGANRANWKNFPLQTVSQEQWNQLATINAGESGELGTVNETFGNFKGFWDSILAQVMGPYNPARNDPEVLRVIAEFAARPDMDPAELQNKLQATKWYQQHTQQELEWNGLPAAEQQKRRDEAAARAADTWFQYVGERIEENDPRIVNYIEQLASGKMGWGQFSAIIKDQAKGVAESPYNRELRTEQEAQRQRGIDVENTAQNIRQTLNNWGINWTDAMIMDWSKKIVEKISSDDDLLQAIKQQAQVLYPWKDPEMETRQAAQPWLAVFERRMEKAGSLNDARVQKALVAGQTPWDFEQELKRSGEWLTTKNGEEEMIGVMAEASKRMGFY
jgi:hypothetical protein